MISCFLQRLPSTKNVFLQRLSVSVSAGSRITRTVSAGSYLPSTIVSAGSKRQSQRKPNMTNSLCRKRTLADSFIPCEYSMMWALEKSSCMKVDNSAPSQAKVVTQLAHDVEMSLYLRRCMVTGDLRKGTNQNGTEQKQFTE